MNSGPRFGVSTAAFFPRSLAETFDILAQQPWKYVELMPQSPDECRPQFAERLHALADGRLRFCALHFPQILAPFLYNPYPSAFTYGQQLCEGLGKLAGALGCTVIVVHGPWANMASGAFLDATLSNLRLLCDTCLHLGTTVALENTTSSPFAGSPDAMMAFADHVDRPNFGFAVDITHAYQLGQDPMIYLEALPEIVHVHASDYDRGTNQRHVPPGQGAVHWTEIMGALRERNFTGNFVIELLPSTLGEDPVRTLQACVRLLEPLFQQGDGTNNEAAGTS